MPDDSEARLRDFFVGDPHGAVAVYLFGSVARGEARPDSDVDIGVLFEANVPATLDAPQFGLEAELERRLGRRVQVIALNRAPAGWTSHPTSSPTIAWASRRPAATSSACSGGQAIWAQT